MKGIVFTEFMEMVDTEFGIQTTENIIAKSNLANGGAYTSVGTYPHSELVTLVVNLGKEKEIPVSNLLEHFGGYLFERFKISLIQVPYSKFPKMATKYKTIEALYVAPIWNSNYNTITFPEHFKV